MTGLDHSFCIRKRRLDAVVPLEDSEAMAIEGQGGIWQLPAQGKEGLWGVAAEVLPLITTLHIDLEQKSQC